MLAVATLAAQLHESACHEPAAAITPLSAISRPTLTSSAAMLFTSSGNHPDAREVMRRLGRPGMHPAAVLTHRPKAELLPLPAATVITLPTLAVPDGFLAVNSVMSMSVALIRAYLGDDALPHELPALSAVDPLPQTVDHLLPPPPSLTDGRRRRRRGTACRDWPRLRPARRLPQLRARPTYRTCAQRRPHDNPRAQRPRCTPARRRHRRCTPCESHGCPMALRGTVAAQRPRSDRRIDARLWRARRT